MAVYLIRAGDTDRVKIGYAVNANDRIRFLQAGHWETLHILRIMEGDRHTEGWLHRRFRHVQISREWFWFDPDMLAVDPIVEMPKPGRAGRAACEMSGPNPVSALIENAGGAEKLGALVGVSRTTVLGWRQSGKIPACRVKSLNEATGVSIEVLFELSTALPSIILKAA